LIRTKSFYFLIIFTKRNCSGIFSYLLNSVCSILTSFCNPLIGNGNINTLSSFFVDPLVAFYFSFICSSLLSLLSSWITMITASIGQHPCHIFYSVSSWSSSFSFLNNKLSYSINSFTLLWIRKILFFIIWSPSFLSLYFLIKCDTKFILLSIFILLFFSSFFVFRSFIFIL